MAMILNCIICQKKYQYLGAPLEKWENMDPL